MTDEMRRSLKRMIAFLEQLMKDPFDNGIKAQRNIREAARKLVAHGWRALAEGSSEDISEAVDAIGSSDAMRELLAHRKDAEPPKGRKPGALSGYSKLTDQQILAEIEAGAKPVAAIRKHYPNAEKQNQLVTHSRRIRRRRSELGKEIAQIISLQTPQ